MARLREAGFAVGDNEPYSGALEGDTLYQHGTLRGLPHVLIEIRQDLIASRRCGTSFCGTPASRSWMPRFADMQAADMQEVTEPICTGKRDRSLTECVAALPA